MISSFVAFFNLLDSDVKVLSLVSSGIDRYHGELFLHSTTNQRC